MKEAKKSRKTLNKINLPTRILAPIKCASRLSSLLSIKTDKKFNYKMELSTLDLGSEISNTVQESKLKRTVMNMMVTGRTMFDMDLEKKRKLMVPNMKGTSKTT